MNFAFMVSCIPVITRKVLTWRILLTIIGYLYFIRRGGCSFSPIINNITVQIKSFFHICSSQFGLLFVSLVSAGGGEKKMSLPDPPVRDGQR